MREGYCGQSFIPLDEHLLVPCGLNNLECNCDRSPPIYRVIGGLMLFSADDAILVS